MIRRPPRSPLFPNTTLFRSRKRARLELHAFPAVLAAERVPPGLRGHVGFPGGVRALQLRERLGQPLGDQRQLPPDQRRSEEHTSELQSLAYLVCRLLLEKKK